MVEIAEAVGPAQDGDVGQDLQLRLDRVQPRIARAALELGERAALGQQRSAEHRLALAQDHARAAATGGQGRHQPGRAAADDQHVAMGMAMQVAVGIGLVGPCPGRRRGG